MAEIEINEKQRAEIFAALKKYRNEGMKFMKLLEVIGFDQESGLVDRYHDAVFEAESNALAHALELVGVEEPDEFPETVEEWENSLAEYIKIGVEKIDIDRMLGPKPPPKDTRPKFTVELVLRVQIATSVEVHADTKEEAGRKAQEENDADLDVASGWEVEVLDEQVFVLDY